MTELHPAKMTVVYFARTRECTGTAEEWLELSDATSLHQVFSRVMTIHPTLAEIQQILRPLVNGRWASDDTEIKDGGRVAIIPPVGGG